MTARRARMDGGGGKVGRRRANAARRPQALVIGGAGSMGRWFCGFLDSMGYAVRTVDPAGATPPFPRARSIPEGLDGLGPRDVVLVCAPMRAAGRALGEVRRVGTRALVADVCSIKAPVRAELRRMAAAGMTVASLHPMWGPDAVLLSDKNLLVVDCGQPGGVRAAKRLFRRTAVRIHDVPLAAHDELMGWVLGLPHAVNLAFARALRGSGLGPRALAELGGPTFRQQLAVAQQVAGENKALYHGIQALNPRAPGVQRAFERALGDVGRARRSEARFLALMGGCEAYFREAGMRRRRNA